MEIRNSPCWDGRKIMDDRLLPPKRLVKAARAMEALSPDARIRLRSIRDTAEYLGVSTWTVREMIWRGELPHVRIGRRILLDIRDLEAFIARKKGS
jgi:excisionase family DNA binding protein